MLKIKYIQTIHDIALVYPSGLLLKGEENNFLNNCLLTIWWGSINRWLFGSPDEVRFPSSWLKNFYQEKNFFKNSSQKIVANYTIKIDNLLDADNRSISKEKTTFIYIGQIEKHKGILFLLETFAKLSATAKYTLRIVGIGSQLALAKKIATGNISIEFYNWQEKASVVKLLRDSDYTIVPSLCYENSPTVIFESLSAGVPVIASNLGGIPELISDGVNGRLFTAHDADSLLKNISLCFK
jgi:glycosyltransferase involved in cell wall biosynthesis